MQADTAVFVGLNSGTSMDGIDTVAVDFSRTPPALLAAATVPFGTGVAARLDRIRNDPDNAPAADLARLDALLGEELSRAAMAVIEQAGVSAGEIRAIGSHGQTVLHRPDDAHPHTLQIGDAHRIARRTGIVTVADFRRADLAAGGQGAPLAPLLHEALLRSSKENRAVINLGGIANVTLLAIDGRLRGFDTGPANCLLDTWYRHHHDGPFDAGGQWAASGQPDIDWLEQLLGDPYFARPAPKSTGIEHFSANWLWRKLPEWAAKRPADIQATLAELTARSIDEALSRESFHPQRVLVCGGGVHNRDLMSRLERHLPGIVCESTGAHGIDPDHVEAVLFAWLARARLDDERIDTRPVTGAEVPVLSGTLFVP